MKLKDKVALVTGTSPNIGGGLAEALASEGAAVVSVDASAANANARRVAAFAHPPHDQQRGDDRGHERHDPGDLQLRGVSLFS